MKIILAFLVVLLSGCAAAQTVPDTTPSGLIGVLITDFQAAQADYTAAAAAQPAGSTLATRFTSNAQCMADAISKLQGTLGVGGGSVKGIFSLGATVDIQVSIAQAQLAQGNSPACNELIGQMVTNLNSQLLRSLPLMLLPKL